MIHPSRGFCRHARAVVHIGAGVKNRVAVEYLAIMSGVRYADAIIFPRHRREVERNDHARTIPRAAQIAEH